MGYVTHAQQLQDIICRKLDNGGLPTKAPLRLGVQRGTGAICDACDGHILITEIEHEFIYPNGLSFRLHFDCAALWVVLWRKRQFPGSGPAS
jgi:hypothetical protein